MKLKIVAVVVTGLLAANVAHAAEVYNKDGNKLGSDSNLLIVFYVQIMPDDLVMQLHRF